MYNGSCGGGQEQHVVTPAQAASVYLEYQPIVDAISSELEAAKKVLKAHLADKARPYKGIALKVGESRRFDQALAKELLGPRKVDQCMVATSTTSLVLPPHLSKGAVVLRYELLPATASAEEPTPA
jgi:hypothetical protein